MLKSDLMLVPCFAIAASSTAAFADSSPPDLTWETEGIYEGDLSPFRWDFGYDITPEQLAELIGMGYAPRDGIRVWARGGIVEGSSTAFPDFGYGWPGSIGSDGCNGGSVGLTFDGRGFAFEPCAFPSGVTWMERVYVPESGGDFARLAHRIEVPPDADLEPGFVFSGALVASMFSELVVAATSSGDGVLDADDDWAVFDDPGVDGDGLPALGVVWQDPQASSRATAVSLDEDDIFMTYQFHAAFDTFAVAPGQAATLVFFAIQANRRTEAVALARELSALGGAGGASLDEEHESLANFEPATPGGPRLRWQGAYTVSEGGQAQVTVLAEHPQGETVAFAWDLDGDSAFDDGDDATVAHVSAAQADGPSRIPVVVRATDQSARATVRHLTLDVLNVPPAIGSTPPMTARTGAPYSYPIAATDVPGDALGYALEEAPTGMTVDAAGLVEWTPSADGAGPEVPVTVVVRDDDGGETRQSWTIQMAGAPTVMAGGPYETHEGGEVRLSPTVADPEGAEVSIAWDLDGDGEYDDSTEREVTWTAEGVDGPSTVQVRLTASDGDTETRAAIPVEVRNVAPEFRSVPPRRARPDSEWVYTMDVRDHGGDAFELTLEGSPPEDLVFWERELRWTPGRVTSDPVRFDVVATDDDGAVARQAIEITVSENHAPPAPLLVAPASGGTAGDARLAVELGNVEDPDGDPLRYFVEVDREFCFCTAELQSSGPLAPGDGTTRWTAPLPLIQPAPGAEPAGFFLRRWASDGLLESDRELSSFSLEPRLGEAGTPAEGGASCDCRAAGQPPRSGSGVLIGCVALLALGLAARRRRGAQAFRVLLALSSLLGSACAGGGATSIADAGAECPALCGDTCCGLGERCVDDACCLAELACEGACCAAGETCLVGACAPACDGRARCGERGQEACCAGTELCSLGRCTEPGDACSTHDDCAADDYCEPTLTRCLPRAPADSECVYGPARVGVQPVVEWAWTAEGLAEDLASDVWTTPMVADLDGDEVPEVVFPSSANGRDGFLRAVHGDTGEEYFSVAAPAVEPLAPVAIGDLDGDGWNEIVVCAPVEHSPFLVESGRNGVLAFEHDGQVRWSVRDDRIRCGVSAPAIADLDGDGRAEIVIRHTVLDASGAVVWTGRESLAAGVDPGEEEEDGPFLVSGVFGPDEIPVVTDIDLDGQPDVVYGNIAYDARGAAIWDVATFQEEYAKRNGYTAVADFDLDGDPDLVASTGLWWERFDEPRYALYAYDGPSGALLWRVENRDRIVPVVANLDGDRTPEVGYADGDGYRVLNAEDGSEAWRVPFAERPERWFMQMGTGSTVFDFDGDGAAEIVALDTASLRVLRGHDGQQIFATCNTTYLNSMPVVADVDGDGHAEIVAASTGGYIYDKFRCTDGSLPPRGVRVFGNAGRGWVPTRTIWNQNSYHVTNVGDDGSVPVRETSHVLEPNRNAFRRQEQAPFLELADLFVGSLHTELDECPREARLWARIENGGVAGTQAGVPVTFYLADGEPIGTTATTGPILPGGFELVSVGLDLEGDLGTQSFAWYAVVGDAGAGPTDHRDCRPANARAEAIEAVCPVFE